MKSAWSKLAVKGTVQCLPLGDSFSTLSIFVAITRVASCLICVVIDQSKRVGITARVRTGGNGNKMTFIAVGNE